MGELKSITQARHHFPGLVARNRNTHVLGKLITACGDLTHSLEYQGVVVPFPALVAHPGRNVLNDNQRFAVPGELL